MNIYTLAKIQVRAMFRAGDIRGNVVLEITRLCIGTSCLCPSEGHKCGGRKLAKTCHRVFYEEPVQILKSQRISYFFSSLHYSILGRHFNIV